MAAIKSISQDLHVQLIENMWDHFSFEPSSAFSSSSEDSDLLLFACLRTPLCLPDFGLLDLSTPPADTTLEKHSFTLYFMNGEACLVDYTIECDTQYHGSLFAGDLIPEHIIIHLLSDVTDSVTREALQNVLFYVVKQRRPEWQPESIKIHEKIDTTREVQIWWEVEFIMEKYEEPDDDWFEKSSKKVHFEGDGCTTKRDSIMEPEAQLHEYEYTFMA